MASVEQEKVGDNEEEIRGRRSRILRIAGEFPSRRELHEMELVAEKENMEAQEIVALLTELSVKTGMPITQENGQRCFGPPRDWHGPTPPKGCEVFVGKLPRDIFEPHLVPLFSTVGDIFQIRLMMDFSGTNRGYCFVQYKTPEEAKKAIRELNNYEVSPGRRIGVLKSVDNCRLFIGNIPKDKSEEEILEEISRHTEGVKRVIAYPSAEDKTKNRGFAFVEYESHKAAAMARRKLIPGNILPWGQDVCVDWAEPEPEVDPEIMNKVQNLYVRNLMLSTTEERLRKIFNEVSSNGVEKVKKIKDYAFVHFSSREKADAARIALNKTDIDGATVEISWAKPAERSTDKAPRQWRQHSPQGNSSPTSSGSFRGRRRDFGRMHFSPTSPGAYQFLPVSPVMDPYLMYGYPSPIPGIQTGYRKTVESPMEIFPNYYRPGGLSDPGYYHDAVAHKSMMFHANYGTEY